MDDAALARAYYDAIDAGDYDALRGVLAPEFEHIRPDMTLSGREEFVAFMRDDRPRTDTRHVVDAVYDGAEGVAVHGRLLAVDDGRELFAFVDAFDTADGEIRGLTTYAGAIDSTAGSTSSS
ncbi:nuclear transport factor 2 family protein [Halobacterium noricense]|uniref:nuclear transport factor 2 family protein n=1 Tax=Halobacterium noricense TaxID=223182 RepID=UPI001E466DFF|nr:nuclear transport factor 2 family protein [Halobacterium noricense]UHH25012.1 nuclear transport factor 2 family protein [Halobacterium noricense]